MTLKANRVAVVRVSGQAAGKLGSKKSAFIKRFLTPLG